MTDRVENVQVEIQIRTIGMDFGQVWSTKFIINVIWKFLKS